MGSIYFFGSGMQVNRSEIESGQVKPPPMNSSLDRYERLLDWAHEHHEGADILLDRARREGWDPMFFRDPSLLESLTAIVRNERPGIPKAEATEIAGNISSGLYEAYMSLDPHATFHDTLHKKILEAQSPQGNLKRICDLLREKKINPDDIVAIEVTDGRDLDLSQPEALCKILEEHLSSGGAKHKLHTIDTLATIPRTSPTYESNIAASNDTTYMPTEEQARERRKTLTNQMAFA